MRTSALVGRSPCLKELYRLLVRRRALRLSTSPALSASAPILMSRSWAPDCPVVGSVAGVSSEPPAAGAVVAVGAGAAPAGAGVAVGAAAAGAVVAVGAGRAGAVVAVGAAGCGAVTIMVPAMPTPPAVPCSVQ